MYIITISSKFFIFIIKVDYFLIIYFKKSFIFIYYFLCILLILLSKYIIFFKLFSVIELTTVLNIKEYITYPYSEWAIIASGPS